MTTTALQTEPKWNVGALFDMVNFALAQTLTRRAFPARAGMNRNRTGTSRERLEAFPARAGMNRCRGLKSQA